MSFLDKLFKKEKPYDPARFDEYFSSGVMIITKGRNMYNIFGQCRRVYSEDLDGVKADCVGFFEVNETDKLKRFLPFDYREDLKKLVVESSKVPSEGLVMVIALAEESAQKLQRSGVLTNKIELMKRLK